MQLKKNKNLSEKVGGFTLVELLIYTMIFTIVSVLFVSILVSTTQIQVRQTAIDVVNQESQFLLQTIQNNIQSASLINIATSTPTSTLSLKMSSSTLDPTSIFASSTAVYLQQGSGQAFAITSNKVSVSGLTFARIQNPPARDTVSVSFVMAYNTNQPQGQFSQTIESAITRVGAATFDSNLMPASNNNYTVGSSNYIWQAMNGMLYFVWSGGNPYIGIGQSNPQQTLEVNGGLRLNTSASQPTCNSTARGTLWVTLGGAGKDALNACLQDASGTLAWRTIW